MYGTFERTIAALNEYDATPTSAAKVREAFWLDTGKYPDTRAACATMSLDSIDTSLASR
jgi:hypothetical protein